MADNTDANSELKGRERSLANLKPPFKPGESGNPKGRPRGSGHTFESVMQKHLDKEITDKDGRKLSRRSRLALSAIEHAAKGDAAMMRLIMERVWPAVQQLDINMPSWAELAGQAKEATRDLYGDADELGRVPLSPSEYQERLASLVGKWQDEGLEPTQTSGYRKPGIDEGIGSSPQSKHHVWPPMASDWTFAAAGGGTVAQDLEAVARSSGFWAVYHDAGSGDHLHIQGLPLGPISAAWMDAFATEATREWAREVYS